VWKFSEYVYSQSKKRCVEKQQGQSLSISVSESRLSSLPVSIGDESDDVSQEFVHGRLCSSEVPARSGFIRFTSDLTFKSRLLATQHAVPLPFIHVQAIFILRSGLGALESC
jgi:hypothetical protein